MPRDLVNCRVPVGRSLFSKLFNAVLTFDM